MIGQLLQKINNVTSQKFNPQGARFLCCTYLAVYTAFMSFQKKQMLLLYIAHIIQPYFQKKKEKNRTSN